MEMSIMGIKCETIIYAQGTPMGGTNWTERFPKCTFVKHNFET